MSGRLLKVDVFGVLIFDQMNEFETVEGSKTLEICKRSVLAG